MTGPSHSLRTPAWRAAAALIAAGAALVFTAPLVAHATTATSISVTGSPNPATTDQQVTYTATVTPMPDAGTVSFRDDSGPISTCATEPLTGDQATCTQTYSAQGTYHISAT